MTVDPLLDNAPIPMPMETVTKSRKGAGRAFDALLQAAGKGEAGSGIKAQQAALELMRIEMMQSTLALAGEDAAPSTTRGIQSLLISVAAGARQGMPLPGRQAAMTAPPQLSEHPPETADWDSDGIGRTAASFLGTPYLFGGEGANGIDCSSFVQQVFREHRISLPRTAREQMTVGRDVPQADLKKGDLVFFHTYASYPSHVGIYVGDGKMIHASSVKGEVTVCDMNSEYYRSRFIGAKRIA